MNAYHHTLTTASPMAELNALPESEGFMRMVDAMQGFPLVNGFASDEAFREALAFSNNEWRQFANAEIDRGMAAGKARQAAIWAEQERANG